MPLPALQVRVPNPANALLQAEQIKGAREQAADRATARQSRNALLQASQGADLMTPGGQQQIVNALAASNPLAALQAQLQISQANAQPGFTLSPGGTRFDAQGNPVASLPATPQAPPRPVSVAPGSSLIDPTTGATIASVPATPPRPTAFDQRVSELRARGFTQQEAQDIAAGRVRPSQDPITGRTTLVNTATAQSTPVTGGTTLPQAVLTAEETGRLHNQNASISRVLGLSEGLEESAAAAAGPRGNLGALVNSLAGIMGRDAPLPADEIAAARQDIRLFNQIAKTAIVNNPRFPVAEQQVVQTMLPNPDDFFTNPSGEFNKMLQLQQFLRDTQAQNNQSLGIAAPPVTQLPPEIFNPTTGETMVLQDGRWVPK